MPLRKISLFTACALAVGGGLVGFLWIQWGERPGSVSVIASSDVRFNRDIRPIFSETCFNCHGPDEHSREADLRLDTVDGAYAALEDGGFAIAPGDLEKSEAWSRIVSDDPEFIMPPPDSHFVLSDKQKATVGQWIESGAKYEEHWAFVAPKKSELPKVGNKSWGDSPIDRFVLARLEQEGLEPSEEADRRALIRRLSYDLTGLPPSLKEVHAFLEDDRPDAYEHVVDGLLASPHFGERMASAWLDQARYADTNGYSRDGARTMWLWRDWVIQAYNENKPFDAFIREQIAGDLLPDATPEQVIATGFSRNHMITAEGGTIKLENLTNYAVDRVKTTSEAFLGLTMACSQCHDHKFDPISQEDYYRMFAYFNTLSDEGIDGAGGINAEPTIEAQTPIRHRDIEIENVRTKMGTLETSRSLKSRQLLESWEGLERAELELLGKNLRLHGLKPLMANNPNIPPTMVEFNEDDSIFLKQESIAPQGTFYSFAMKVPEGIEKGLTGVRIEFYPNESVNDGSLGYGVGKNEGAFGVSAVSISSGTVPVADFDLNSEVVVGSATASYSHPDHPAYEMLDPRWPTAWSPLGKAKQPQHLTLTFAEPIDPDVSPYLSVMINFQQIANAGHLKVFAMTGRDDGTNMSEDIQKILYTDSSDRSARDVKRISEYHALNDHRLASLNTEIAIHRNRLEEMTAPYSTQVMDTAKEPRKTYMLNRGSYDQPGEEVSPGVPSFLPPLPEGSSEDRLGLADWFVDPKHPLTSRVAVNRIWQLFFGTGFVATSADFGSQGEWPSHPELLDYLAVDFVEGGWKVKALIKNIVTSATYRQASNVTDAIVAIDPNNRLLSHGPRFRLSAEFIRDSALKTSGLMNDWIGGSSVKPYQPRGIWREISHYGSVKDLTQVFVQDKGSNLYRRSLYTLWKRTSPPPSMMAFDAPNRELCMMSRETTNTPLQALTLLNDPQYVEAGRAFAERILLETPDAKSGERVALAFETVTGRLANEAELDELVRALEDQRAYFESNPQEAIAVLSVGESKRNENLDTVDHAAYAVLANLIFNLSESITKG